MTLDLCKERSWDCLGRADGVHENEEEDVEHNCSALAKEAGPLRRVFNIRQQLI